MKDIIQTHSQIPNLGLFIDYDDYLDKHGEPSEEINLIAKGFADMMLSDLQAYMTEFYSCLYSINHTDDRDFTIEELYVYQDRIKLYYDIISPSYHASRNHKSIWRFIDTTIYDLWNDISDEFDRYNLDGIFGIVESKEYVNTKERLNSLIKEKENGTYDIK
jgi:hypothetical protein